MAESVVWSIPMLIVVSVLNYVDEVLKWDALFTSITLDAIMVLVCGHFSKYITEPGLMCWVELPNIARFKPAKNKARMKLYCS